MKKKRFLYITSFADILNRYTEIKIKFPLRYTALSFLITRGGSLTPTEMAQLMFRSKHSVTKIIDALEKDGYAVRIPDKEDRRSIKVKITTHGLEHARKGMSRGDDHVKDLISCLTDEEWDNLLNYIKRLRSTLIEKMKEP
jgi:DNA-binding MarR family transcriptional regulator